MSSQAANFKSSSSPADRKHNHFPELHVQYHHGSGTDEILRPTLMSVSDGRCYRKLTDVSFGKMKKESTMEWRDDRERRDARGVHEGRDGMDKEPSRFNDDVYDEGDENAVDLVGVEPTPGGGGFTLKVNIPSIFFKYIIGRQGNTKASIEKETKCRIRIPQRGVEGEIVIESQTIGCIADAKRRLDIVVWSNRLKEPITHFISIPLNHPAVMERLETFNKDVLTSCCKNRGICEEVFQVPAKFHLTLGVMRLFNKEEEEKAQTILEDCLMNARVHLGSESALIRLYGVECMKDDPSEVDVLYAKVSLSDSSNRLQKFVDTVVELFLEKAPDLMSKEFERTGVKLHATLMNSKFRSTSDEGKDKGAQRGRPHRDTFDAQGIFKVFGDFEFGQVPLQRVHLSKRGEYGPDRFYKCIKEYNIDTISCKYGE